MRFPHFLRAFTMVCSTLPGRAVSAALAVLCLASVVAAEIYTFDSAADPTPWQDTRIFRSSSNSNYGDQVLSSRADNNSLSHNLVQVDTSGILSTEVVTGASLKLTTDFQHPDTTSVTLTVHRLLQPWDEFEATWNERLNGTAWSTPGMQAGVDYSSTVITTQTLTANETHTFDLGSPAGLAMVQDWISNPTSNYGLALVATPSGGTTREQFNFVHSESTTADSGVKPILIITTVPEPTTLLMLAVGALGFVICGYRRKK